MLRRLTLPQIAFLAISVTSLAGAAFFFFTRPGLPSNKDPEALKIRAERDALAEYSDAALATLEVRKREAESRLPSQAEVAKFIDDLKANWNVQSLGRVETKHVGTRRYMLTNKSQRFRGGNDRQWNDVVSTVKSLDSQPGFIVQSIVISSSVNQGITYGQVAVTIAVSSRDDTPAAAAK